MLSQKCSTPWWTSSLNTGFALNPPCAGSSLFSSVRSKNSVHAERRARAGRVLTCPLLHYKGATAMGTNTLESLETSEPADAGRPAHDTSGRRSGR